MKFLVVAKAEKDALSLCERIRAVFQEIDFVIVAGEEVKLASLPTDCDAGFVFTDDIDKNIIYAITGLFPDRMIVFMTHEEHLIIDTKMVHMGYILRIPFTNEELQLAIQIVYFVSRSSFRHVYAKMFGRFELLKDEHPIHFANRKAKELLALCIDHRGGEVSIEEATDKLWENRAYDQQVKNLYRKAVMSLHATLESAGITDLLINGRGYCRVDTTMFSCDYYNFLVGGRDGLKAYDQARTYLFDYSWAEETRDICENIFMNIKK